MKRLIIILLVLAAPLAYAQEERDMTWVNVTALHLAATGGTDEDHTLQQYLLFDDEKAEVKQEQMDRLAVFGQEFQQMSLNRRIPEGVKELDESVAEIKKMIKENPELADVLRQNLAEAEEARASLLSEQDPSVNSYTYNPAILLRNLTRLAVNQKAYTGWRDIGGGLFAVTEGPRFGPVEEDAFSPVRFQEGYEYTWGVIDYDGHSVMAPKYSRFWALPEQDIIFLNAKEKDGSLRTGARGYDGRIRIPFVYDYLVDYFTNPVCIACFCKDGKFGYLDYDGKVLWPFEFTTVEHIGSGWYVSKDGKNHGVVDYKGRLSVPLKYKGMWDESGGELKMMLPDGRLDVYDNSKPYDYRFLRTDPVPEM